jgi:hypothetical protein
MATISKVITFVPTIGENNKQFQVRLRAVKVEKKQTQIRKFVEMDPKKLMKEMLDSRQQGEIKELLKEHFIRFVNFDVTDEVSEKDVEDKKVLLIQGESEPREVTAADIGKTHLRPAGIDDIFELGEYELAMEMFMHMIGHSQLRGALRPGTDPARLTTTEEREDEEKNSESPSGSSPIH